MEDDILETVKKMFDKKIQANDETLLLVAELTSHFVKYVPPDRLLHVDGLISIEDSNLYIVSISYMCRKCDLRHDCNVIMRRHSHSPGEWTLVEYQQLYQQL